MKKKQSNIPIDSSGKFALILAPECIDGSQIKLPGGVFEVVFGVSLNKIQEEFSIFSTNHLLGKKKTIEGWMPYVELKTNFPCKRHVFEITDDTRPEDVEFILEMAYLLEANGIYVHKKHCNVVISYLAANKKKYSKALIDSLFVSNADVFRKQIDTVDNELIQLMKRRTDLVDALADLKRQYHLPMLQHKRWALLIEKRVKKAEHLNLNSQTTMELFNLLHKFALEIHMNRYFNK